MRRDLARPASVSSVIIPRKRASSVRSRAVSCRSDDYDDEQLIQHILNGGTLKDTDSEVFVRLIAKLKDDRDDMIINNMFNESELADEAAKRVSMMQTASVKTSFQKEQRAMVQERLDQTKQEFEQLKQVIKAQEEHLIAELDRQMKELEDKQQQEVDAITEEWRSPAKMRQYNRTSPQLRNLRTQQLKLLNAHRYDEMRTIQKKADAQEQKETEEMQNLMLLHYSMVLAKTEDRHALEMKQLKSVQDQKLDNLAKSKKADYEVMEKRIAKVERALQLCDDTNAVWNVKHHNEFDSPAPTSKSMTARIIMRRGKPIDPTEFNTLKLTPVPAPKTVRKSLRRTTKF